MKTAMQELLSEISHPNWDRLSFDARYEMFDKLLDLEKEQIIDAYENGVGDENERNLSGKFTNAEEYYNQTFNQDRITISETRRSIEEIGLLKKQSEGVGWWWKGRE